MLEKVTWTGVKHAATRFYASAQRQARALRPVVTTALLLPILPAFGICWERSLREDVAAAARQKILKDLTKLPEFEELISEIEPAIRDAIGQAMAEITRLERDFGLNRAEFQKQQDAVIEMIEKKVWESIEPKIKDVQKKKRIREWIDNLKGRLKEVDEIQRQAAEILRENVREILHDFNGKCEDELGQNIPGEIEGTDADKAMHELAETIVEKIMDRNLDFDVALSQVVAEIKQLGVLDAEGREKLVAGLLADSKTNDGGTDLRSLFEGFRNKYLDPGSGELGLPKRTDLKTLDRAGSDLIRDRSGQTNKGGLTDGSSSN